MRLGFVGYHECTFGYGLRIKRYPKDVKLCSEWTGFVAFLGVGPAQNIKHSTDCGAEHTTT